MLVDHDPRWAARFEEWRSELRQCGDGSWVVEHIGSTARPGLVVKPVVVDQNPVDRKRHAEVKVRARVAAAAGVSSYNPGKTDFVQEIVDRARKNLGREPVPVYDE